MKLVKISLEEINKEAGGPQIGSFYILNNAIYYSTINQGIPHDKLWKEIVLKSGVFDKLIYENKKDLIESPYATHRGRVTWCGKFTADERPNLSDPEGYFMIYGTPGCKPFKDKLKSIFKLKNLRKDIKVKEDWTSDNHYKVKQEDKNTLQDMIQLLGKDKLESIQSTHIARIIDDPIKEVVRKHIKSLTR